MSLIELGRALAPLLGALAIIIFSSIRWRDENESYRAANRSAA